MVNAKVAEYSYDAWGRMRNVATWANYTPGSEPALMIAGRGCTGHEHLPWFNLINMNGRLYDPLTAQFLSADKYVLDPTFSSSYNRYSYCLNNPLKYIDPSGLKSYLTQRDGGDDYLPINYLSKSGITSCVAPNYSSMMVYGSYVDAMSQGYKGSYDTFSRIYGDQIINSAMGATNLNETLTVKYLQSWTSVSEIINGVNVITAYRVYGYANIKIPSGGGNLPSWPENAAAALGTLAGMLEAGKVSGDMWYSPKTGKWYPISNQPNGITGPRNTVLEAANTWHNIAKGAFFAGAIYSTGDMIYYYANGGAGWEKAAWTGTDIAVGAIAMWGGPPGMVIGIIYFVVTNPRPNITPSPYITDPMSPWNTMPRIDNTGINNGGGF